MRFVFNWYVKDSNNTCYKTEKTYHFLADITKNIYIRL